MFRHISSYTDWRRTEPGCQGLLSAPGPSTHSPCVAGPLTLQTGLAFPTWKGCFKRWGSPTLQTHLAFLPFILSPRTPHIRQACLDAWNLELSSEPKELVLSSREFWAQRRQPGATKMQPEEVIFAFWSQKRLRIESSRFSWALDQQRERSSVWKGKRK